MPFEPFYHRDPKKPFAQHKPGETLYVVARGDGLTEWEFETTYREYIKWIDGPLAEIGLTFSWNMNQLALLRIGAGARTEIRVMFKKTGIHGLIQKDARTYEITHNIQDFEKDKKRAAHLCLHEFLHMLGVPHEINNPLVHFCLKPNWEKILNWESVRDSKAKDLRSKKKTEEADYVSVYADQGLIDFYWCLRWTLFSDDTEIAYQFDPYHAVGGSVHLFHLYMDQIPGTEDIYTDKGIVADSDRLMTPALKTFLKSRFTTSRFTTQKVFTRLNGRRKWFLNLNAQGTYDPKIFLPDEYLRKMTYKHPFMKQLIDDKFACAEDMQWFKYETMHRYINLSGTDAETRAKCALQFPHSGCDPFGKDNFLNIWNKETKAFSICPAWAGNLRDYCILTSEPPLFFVKPRLAMAPNVSVDDGLGERDTAKSLKSILKTQKVESLWQIRLSYPSTYKTHVTVGTIVVKCAPLWPRLTRSARSTLFGPMTSLPVTIMSYGAASCVNDSCSLAYKSERDAKSGASSFRLTLRPVAMPGYAIAAELVCQMQKTTVFQLTYADLQKMNDGGFYVSVRDIPESEGGGARVEVWLGAGSPQNQGGRPPDKLMRFMSLDTRVTPLGLLSTGKVLMEVHDGIVEDITVLGSIPNNTRSSQRLSTFQTRYRPR
jgi:hypothetical protein